VVSYNQGVLRASLTVCAVALLVACGPSSRRSMKTPAHAVTYDDACGLQDYFDQRRAASLPRPSAEDEVIATNEKGQTIGEGTYKLHDPLAKRRFARLLREEYSGIDAKILRAAASTDDDVTIRVRWWDSGQVRRLRPEDDVIVTTSAGAVELPPNMCVSDLLFGDRIYELRAKYLRNEVDLATDKTPTP
jgi:hypothetical protein